MRALCLAFFKPPPRAAWLGLGQFEQPPECRECSHQCRLTPSRSHSAGRRHTPITAALDATEGNARAVQKLSRHAKIDTLTVYDDARQKQQKAISEVLSTLA
jgi:integrase